MSSEESENMNNNPSENIQSCCPHDNCFYSSLKGARQGFYYAFRLRFAHSFVMSFLFGKGTLKERFMLSLRMALDHGKILAIFASFYKMTVCIFANLRNKRCPLNSLAAGYIGAQLLLKLKTNLVINR